MIGKLVPVEHLSSIKKRKTKKINLGNVQIKVLGSALY